MSLFSSLVKPRTEINLNDRRKQCLFKCLPTLVHTNRIWHWAPDVCPLLSYIFLNRWDYPRLSFHLLFWQVNKFLKNHNSHLLITPDIQSSLINQYQYSFYPNSLTYFRIITVSHNHSHRLNTILKHNFQKFLFKTVSWCRFTRSS